MQPNEGWINWLWAASNPMLLSGGLWRQVTCTTIWALTMRMSLHLDLAAPSNWAASFQGGQEGNWFAKIMTAEIMFATSQRYWNIIRKLCQVVICISKTEILYMKYIKKMNWMSINCGKMC